jgi:hypothetical protein
MEIEINGDWESGLILGRDTPWRVSTKIIFQISQGDESVTP